MITRTTTVELDGRAFHRISWLPSGEIRAAAVLVHGHGDCAERHENTVTSLVDRGIACSAVDLPGHGRSPGRRGDVGGFAGISRLLTRLAEEFSREAGVAVEAWVGHSAGGLVLIHHLVTNDISPRFVWLSSPLIDPAAGRSRVVVAVGRAMARRLPWVTLSTGVRLSDCRVSDDPDARRKRIGGLGHDRITLGWSAEIFELAERLPEVVQGLDPSVRVLFTQGLDDPVCPPEQARQLFERIPVERKRWFGIEGARHEPFGDSFAPVLQREVGEWLDREVYTSPSG